MISCYDCRACFEDWPTYMRHIKLTHQLNTYSCSVLNYEKTFSVLDSFLRHVRDKNKTGVSANQSPLPSSKKIFHQRLLPIKLILFEE